MPGARYAPAVSCEENTRSLTTGSPDDPGIPCANGFNAYSTLSPAIGLFVTVPGVKRQLHRRVDVSVETSGPRGFASASRALVFSRLRRPSLPASNVRDDRETPLLIGRGMGRILPVIWHSDQPQRAATD
jgi:hypothetical protein